MSPPCSSTWDGRIRFFTPAIRALFAIIPSDVGRKLTDFAALAPDGALADDVTAVQDRLEPQEREIEAADGTWFRPPHPAIPHRREPRGRGGDHLHRRDGPQGGRPGAGGGCQDGSGEGPMPRSRASWPPPAMTCASLCRRSRCCRPCSPTPSRARKARGLVARQNTTLSTVTGMLDTLLDINEIEAGAVQPNVAVFEVGSLLERLHREFAYHAEAEIHTASCRPL